MKLIHLFKIKRTLYVANDWRTYQWISNGDKIGKPCCKILYAKTYLMPKPAKVFLMRFLIVFCSGKHLEWSRIRCGGFYLTGTLILKWSLSDCIQVLKGSWREGLSSPFLFNLFYQQLIDILNCTLINDVPYNVFCCADDLILTSTSMTGLQKLINCTNNYIVSHGLRFNATKTQCATFGRKT